MRGSSAHGDRTSRDVDFPTYSLRRWTRDLYMTPHLAKLAISSFAMTSSWVFLQVLLQHSFWTNNQSTLSALTRNSDCRQFHWNRDRNLTMAKGRPSPSAAATATTAAARPRGSARADRQTPAHLGLARVSVSEQPPFFRHMD